MDSMLASNQGYDSGFSKGKVKKPNDNPWEIDIKGEKENLDWLL